MGDRLLTTEEAADFLRCSVRHVRALVDTGQLKARRLGRLVRFHRDDLMKCGTQTETTGGTG